MQLGRPTGRVATRGAPLSANELSVELRRADTGIIVVVAGRVTVDSSPRLRPVLHYAIGAGRGHHRFHGGSIDGHLADRDAARGLNAGVETGGPLGVIGLGGETRVVAEATESDRIFLALGYEVQFT
jgi:hypothetical protein